MRTDRRAPVVLPGIVPPLIAARFNKGRQSAGLVDDGVTNYGHTLAGNVSRMVTRRFARGRR
jgi:hypothetical protein